MSLNIILLIVIVSSLSAAIWAFLVGLVWLIVAALARQMSRYWPVVLGTLRGAFLLGVLVGIIKQPSDLEGVLEISGTYCLIGAIGGALWGYYGLTQRLRPLISSNPTPQPSLNPPVRQPRQALQAKPGVRCPAPPPVQPPADSQSERLSEQTAEPSSEQADIEHQETVEPALNPPANRAQPVDNKAIADSLTGG
ncbi:MAG: hypothetical protein AAFN08_11590 [Cyanobacteria bacterium J06559_3]